MYTIPSVTNNIDINLIHYHAFIVSCNKIPGMTAVTYKDGLHLAAGTDTGYVG